MNTAKKNFFFKDSVALFWARNWFWKWTYLRIKWGDVKLTLWYRAGRSRNDQVVQGNPKCAGPSYPWSMWLISSSSHKAQMWAAILNKEFQAANSKQSALSRWTCSPSFHLVQFSHLLHDEHKARRVQLLSTSPFTRNYWWENWAQVQLLVPKPSHLLLCSACE